MDAEKEPQLLGGVAPGGSRKAPSTMSTAADAGSQQSADELMMQVESRHIASAGSKEGPVVCVVCGREGHPCCGMRYWIALRSAWLRVKEEDVAREPASFEDDGPLQLQTANITTQIRDLSEGELEDLEDCLDAVQRPFPRLRRSVPLMQAVQCAETLWDTDE